MTDSDSPFKLSYPLLYPFNYLLHKVSLQTNTCCSILFRPYHVNVSPPQLGKNLLFSRLYSTLVNTSWWQSRIAYALQCKRLILKTNQSKRGAKDCVSLCEVGRALRVNTQLLGYTTSTALLAITFSFYSPFHVFISHPCRPLFVPILWFNCYDQ